MDVHSLLFVCWKMIDKYCQEMTALQCMKFLHYEEIVIVRSIRLRILLTWQEQAPQGTVGPPPQAAVDVPQGAVGGPPAAMGGERAGPPPGSGRAVYRGAGKGPKPGNGAGGAIPKVPADELAQLSIAPEEEERRQYRSPYEDGVYKPSHITEKAGKCLKEIGFYRRTLCKN